MISDSINFLIYDFRLSDSVALATVNKVPCGVHGLYRPYRLYEPYRL